MGPGGGDPVTVMTKKKLKPDPFFLIFLPKFFPVKMMFLELFCGNT